MENAFVACGMVVRRAWEVSDGGVFRARVSSIQAAHKGTVRDGPTPGHRPLWTHISNFCAKECVPKAKLLHTRGLWRCPGTMHKSAW